MSELTKDGIKAIIACTLGLAFFALLLWVDDVTSVKHPYNCVSIKENINVQ
jgi:hypothetical protein